MKNRNSKDPAENHIYPFILSNLFLFIGVFFSLNSADEVGILFYSLSLNLFIHWLLFYLSTKKKIAHYSEFYNNLIIRNFFISSFIPVFLLGITLVFGFSLGSFILLIICLFVSFICKIILGIYLSWETKTEKLINQYRMSIQLEREENFKIAMIHLKNNPEKSAEYIQKSQLFDEQIESQLTNLFNSGR
jgi:hypothetical protein